MLQSREDDVQQRYKQEKMKINKSAIRQIEKDFEALKDSQLQQIEVQRGVNQEVSSKVTAIEYEIWQIDQVPEEQKKLSYLPMLKKQLKEAEKARNQAKVEFEKVEKEVRLFKARHHIPQ